MSDGVSTVHNAGGWVARWAQLRGDAPAVADEERRLDYRSLEERTARLAGWLRAEGVGEGDRVGLLLANRTAYLEAVFATARIGAISLPINTRLSRREVRFVLDDCTPSAILHEDTLGALVDADASPKLRIPMDEYEAGLSAAVPHPEVLPVSPDAPMMLMYTSGTTGQPKGALLPHRKTLFNSLNAQRYFGIGPGDRVLAIPPLFHSLGLLILSVPALYAGASLLLRRHFEPETVWPEIEREGVTYMGGVPTMYQRLRDLLPAPAPPSLRFLFTAGSAVPAELVRDYERRGLCLRQGYGQTETSILCCLDPADAARKAGSVGRPVFHGEVRCVALDALEDEPRAWRNIQPSETGEIVVRGPITMLGYWKRPGETAATLRGGRDGWLRTGDLATVDDEGFFTLVGRQRDMWISGGENVYPAEVETVFAEHPALREIAVVGVPDPQWGEVGRAFVVLEAGHALDPEALTAWGRERLAPFKVPERFVALDELPKTASGKVQKHLLPS